ncbi:hypothetical protein ZYGR_0N00560 [Zygosaccharomyces rouxii]|uniref:CAF17 C-terminal domain-containing protein n=1 Tax=Zygosaccharomyces rouxii TaxID=4956 RepID=A0A1Q2ZYY7_ZYGRO|nr:hypothetical protein ZYGR_0N00560 [Zygosaccharomyces rouxii]
MKAVTIARRFNHATLQYASNKKSFLKIRGPEAPKFLNGLVTSKLLPAFTKKNLTTINPHQEDKNNQLELEFDETHSNWGVFNEMGYNGSYISRFGTYTGILNSKGRLLTDTLLYPSPLCHGTRKSMAWPEYLLEFDPSIGSTLNKMLDLHVLTSKVKTKLYEGGFTSWDMRILLPGLQAEDENPWISNVLEPSTMTKNPQDAQAFAAGLASALFQGNEAQVIAMYIERRTDQLIEADGSMGQQFRVVTKNGVDLKSILNPQGFPFEFKLEEVDPAFFRRLRFEQGYIDSVQDYTAESLLPLELNFDFLPNAVSADKGCYIGQELTARTFATGILRKRLVPVTLFNPENYPLPQGKQYPDISMEPDPNETRKPSANSNPFGNTKTPKRQRPAGSLIASEGNKGVAMLRIEHFKRAFHSEEDDKPFYIATEDGKRIGIIPSQPFWLLDHEEDL